MVVDIADTENVSVPLCDDFAASESAVLNPPSWEVRRQLGTSAGGLLVGMGTAADSGDERNLRRGMTDTTSMFSESNVVVEDDWSSESFFGSESDFEAFTPSAPAVVCDEAATEQRANDALKGLTLTFRDPYLEADYQSARQRELRRSILVFRSTMVVLLVLWLIFNFVTVAFHKSIRALKGRGDLILSFLPLAPAVGLLLCSFRRSFASRFDFFVGSAAVLYVLLQNIVDYRLVSSNNMW